MDTQATVMAAIDARLSREQALTEVQAPLIPPSQSSSTKNERTAHRCEGMH